jgi:hypothetical protein
MRNKKILHGLEETGKYLGKVAIDSGLAEKAVKVVSKIGRRKARMLAGKEGKDAVKMMEADALTGLKKFRGKLEHKTWAEKQGARHDRLVKSAENLQHRTPQQRCHHRRARSVAIRQDPQDFCKLRCPLPFLACLSSSTFHSTRPLASL